MFPNGNVPRVGQTLTFFAVARGVHADPVPLRNTSPFEATTMNVSSVEPNATTFDPPDTGTVPAALQISVWEPLVRAQLSE